VEPPTDGLFRLHRAVGQGAATGWELHGMLCCGGAGWHGVARCGNAARSAVAKRATTKSSTAMPQSSACIRPCIPTQAPGGAFSWPAAEQTPHSLPATTSHPNKPQSMTMHRNAKAHLVAPVTVRPPAPTVRDCRLRLVSSGARTAASPRSLGPPATLIAYAPLVVPLRVARQCTQM